MIIEIEILFINVIIMRIHYHHQYLHYRIIIIIEKNHHDIMPNIDHLNLTKNDKSNVNVRLHMIIINTVQAIVNILSFK